MHDNDGISKSTNVLVTGKSSFPRGEDADIDKIILSASITGTKVLNFDTFEPSNEDDCPEYLKMLESCSINREEVDQRIIEAENKVKSLLASEAVREGYVQSESEMSWRFVYVNQTDWNDICDRLPDGPLTKTTMGRHDTFSNTIYIRYPENLSSVEDMFEIQSTLLHEGRHRVGGKLIAVDMDVTDTVQSEDTVNVNIHINEWTTNYNINILSPLVSKGKYDQEDLHPLEEVFVCGYVAENINKVCSPDVLLPHLDTLSANNVDQRYATLSRFDADGHEEIDNQYKQYLNIYIFLKSEIPDVLNQMSDIRANKSGARNKFAKAVINTFGMNPLKAILNCRTDENLSELHQLLYVVIQNKNGIQVESKSGLDNEQLVEKFYKKVMNDAN